MGNRVFVLLILFAFFLAMEFIMMGAFRLSNSTRAQKIMVLCAVCFWDCSLPAISH